MAVFTRVKTWVSNEVLTASDLNSEFNNLLNNTIPASIEDYSADVATMQSTTDPGGVGSESLATTLAGEIQRLRYKIKQGFGGAQWYSAPSIPTTSIADLAVTRAKMAAVGEQTSSSSGSFSTASSSYVDVTNLTVTLTTTGRPVRLCLVGVAGSLSRIYSVGAAVSSSAFYVKFVQDSTDVSEQLAGVNHASGTLVISPYMPISSFSHEYSLAAGTYVFKVQTKRDGAASAVWFENIKLFAREL